MCRQFHSGYAQPQPPQGWPPQDPAQKPAFFNPQQMAAPASGPPMFFNPASFDSAAVPPFLPQQGPAHPPQQQWDHLSYQQQQQQPTWNSHEVQNGPPHQGGYQGGANNVQQNEYSQQPYSSWQEQDLYAPPQTDPLADSRASSSFYESSGQSSTLGFTFSSENPSLNSSERTSPMLAGGDYGQGGFPYDGMDIPRDGMQQQPPSEGAALFRQPEGNSVPNDSGPVGQYFSSPGNTNTASVPASMPQVSMFSPQFGLPEESRGTASLGQEEGSLTRELTGQEQEENIQQFPPPQNNQPPPIPNFEGSQSGQNWDFGGAPHQEMRRELTGQEDGLDSQMQDPAQFALQQSEPQQAPPVLTVEEPTAGVPTLSPGVPTPSPGILTPSPGHSRNGSQQFDTISLSSGKEGNPSRSGSRASSLIVEGQAQPGVNVTPGVSNSGIREDFDVGTRPVGDHSRSGSVDSGRSGPGVADIPPQSVTQSENVAGLERSRSGSAESGRSARSNRSVSSIPPAPPLNVPYQEGAAMERSRSGSAESGRSGSSGRPPSLSRHNRAESNDSIHSAGSNPALSSQPPLMEEQSPGDGAPSPQPTQTIRPSDVGPGDSPEGAASPDEPTQPQQGDGEPEPPPQNTRPPQARPSGHSPPPPSRPSIPNFPIFSPMEGSMAPQFPFTNNFPPAGPSMPSPIQHSATSPFQPVATRPQPFPARTEHNGFPGEGQDSTPTSGNDNDAAATGRQDREASAVVRQSSREEHHQHSRENLVEREPLPRREDMRNVGEEPRERRTSGLRDSAEGEQSVPPPMPVQPVPTHSHHHAHHRKPEERRESTPTASLWSADVPTSVPSVILAPAAPPTLTQAPSVQPHPVPMFVPAPNLPNNMQAAAASPPEKQQQQQPPASAMPSSAFGTPSTVAATAPTTSASTPSQQSPASNDTYRNASAPPPDSTAGGQQNVPPASTPQSYSTPPSRQTSTVSNSSYTSQPSRPAEERSQERRNPLESQPSPSRSPRQVAGNEGEPEDRYNQRGQPPKPAGQATQPVDIRRDMPPSTQTNQQPSSDGDYSRTRDYRGREGDTSYSTQEPERPSSRSSNHGSDRDWDRDRDERSHDRQDRRDSSYDQRDRRYDNRRDYYQERDYRSRSYEQDPRYARQGSYDSYYERQESRERERPSSRQERERPSSRQGERPRSRQDYDREAYYRQYSAEYDRSGYYDQEKYRRRRDYYGRDYDSRTQRDPRYSRERGNQRSKSVDDTDYGANDPRYQEWYNYYYGRHGNSYDPRYYEYYKQQMQQQQSQTQGYDMYAYDPRYDNTYDDEQYVEDDRRSVHSSASGHSSHSQHSQGWSGQYDDRFARGLPSRRQPGRDKCVRPQQYYRVRGLVQGFLSARWTAVGQSNNHTALPSGSVQRVHVGISPATRTTPAKFHIPHVLARFGPGGHMIKVLPNNPADGMPAVVEVHGLETLLVNNNEVEELRSFHGPLIKGVTHKSDVIRFCQDKAAACLASTDIRDKESAALLWQLLELLCRQNGTIVGTDISELLLQGHPSMAYPQRTEAEGEDRGSQGDLSQASTTSDGTVGGTEAADIERLTQKFRELLLFGRKKDALEWAMKGGLWGHALLLASKMDSRAHANVMTRFANSLPMNDPLQTLYQLMSHRQPAAVTSCADERWGDWRPHLAMVLSNHTQRPEVDRKSIITLGDTLGSRGLLHAAHFCYLMAQANFGHYSKKASKMVLLGSSHSLPFMEFASNEAIQMTEVYEYAMTLGNAAHYILPSFQEYKFLYATRLAECGMTAQALTYCECIVSAVERAPTSFSSTLIGQLHQLSERLFWHDPQFSSLSAEEDQDYEWINSIRYMNQQVLEGALLPSSASDTPMFVGSTEPSIDGTSTPTPGETTYTGMGTPQYDPNQQQEQYEGYNTSGMDPTAYQQQGGTDSPYQQYNQQQQQQQMDPNNYQPWSKPVSNDMNLMASMNSEYSTTSVATTTTDGGTEVENDVPDYYDQMAGQVSFKTLAPSSPEESPGEGPTDTAEEDSENSPRMVQQQHRGTPDSQGSHGRLRALSGSSHASTTRARSMSGSSQLSHGSQRMRRRQRTTSESSQVDIKEEPGQKKQEKSSGGNRKTKRVSVSPYHETPEQFAQLSQNKDSAKLELAMSVGNSQLQDQCHDSGLDARGSSLFWREEASVRRKLFQLEVIEEQEGEESSTTHAKDLDKETDTRREEVGRKGEQEVLKVSTLPPQSQETTQSDLRVVEGQEGTAKAETQKSDRTETQEVPNSRQASVKPKDSNKASQSHQGQKNSAQRSGGTSWLGGLFNKMMRGKNEIHLPDDTNKSIVWDATRGKWINQNEAEEEDAAPPPPPPKDPMPSPAGGPAPPPGNTPNRFSRRAGPTGKYVDVLNQSGTTKPAAPPPDLFPGMAPGGNAMPNLFVPAAVPTSDANEPQGSQLQGTMTQGNPQGTPAPTQAQQQQQQQQPMFYNPNEPTTTAALAPPTSTSNTQAQQPQDNAGPPPADQGMAAPPQGPAAPPMFFNPSSFSGQNSPFNSPGQAPSGLGSRPRYARPR
ncbi:SEC16A [Branchiostoma lanceolatum]|uniref:Protein transport protein sec16 n=1 Tax=Branchiostoma lanceolatum TaxID=7740 RepID=A0A8K0AEC5_BRALA|nr:SEC16A [Branchiostoma lanceolatum]